MKNHNRKGGAGIVAVLAVIMLVCIGTAALIITGRHTIETTAPAKEPQSSSQSDSSLSGSDSSSADEPEEPADAVYPVKSDNYKEVKLKDISCKYSMLVDVNNNTVIAGHGYDKKIYPASLTKMLTLLVAVENISDMNKTYTFKASDIDPLIEENASRAGFEAGEKVTVQDLLYASILVSGADGTLGLAKTVAGSEAGFVKLMNEKITELGLKDTQFVNVSGLHDKRHYTTLQDLAVITRECLNNETCKKILSASFYTPSKTKINPNGILLKSIVLTRLDGYYIDLNKDEKADAKIIGGKSGFTDEAMFTLATICKYKNSYYICLTAKSSTQDGSTSDQIAIYENYLPKTAQ